MRKISVIISALLFVGGINAQNIYDIHRYTSSDLNGTARFVGMGGAMGALGGDISTMGTNPAGIGVYRSNDFMLSFGFNHLHTESNFNDTKMSMNKFSGSFDNIGFVYSNKIGNKTPLRYVNFGFNYTKQRNFNKEFAMGGDLFDSQTNLMAAMGTGISPGQLDKYRNPYDDPRIGWLPIMGRNSNLINPLYHHQDGYFINEYESYMPTEGVDGYFYSMEKGGVHRYDFNISFNVNDAFYIGATLGAYDVNYSKYTFYEERFGVNGDRGDYMLQNWVDTDGAGIDFKLGFIYRPLGTNLRVGAAFHTPTLYNLTDRTYAELDFNTYDPDGKFQSGYVLPIRYYNNGSEEILESVTDYRIITPWKFNLNLGYTIGQSIALGAEYEYADYSTSKIKYDTGSNIYYNKSMLKGVHTLKLGVEARLVPQFSVRAGYNHITGAFNDNAVNDFLGFKNTVKTDTDYNNVGTTNNFTLGMGYRGNLFYADIAYQYNMYKSTFYPFQSAVTDGGGINPTKVNNDRQQVLLTLGMRF